MNMFPDDRASAAGARLLVAAMVTFPVLAQVWIPVGPGADRAYAAATLDTARGVAVRVGGIDGLLQAIGTTIEWNGNQWQIVSLSGPSNRRYSAMAYDPVAGHSVLFGGVGAPSDTWTWDGTSWTQVATTGPTARLGHGMVYDSVRQRILLFGGQDLAPLGSAIALGDTWEWRGGGWTQVASGGPARGEHAMCYDAVRDRVVVFGGYLPFPTNARLGDTWEWNGATWQQVATSGPAARNGAAMAFHAGRTRSVLFGGSGGALPFGDLWEWDGASWSEPFTPGPVPGSRDGHAMVYDPARDRVLVSSSNSQVSLDTWEYGLEPSFESFGSGCDSSRTALVTCQESNPTASGLTGQVIPSELAVVVGSFSQVTELAAFEIYTASSTGNPAVVAARIYPLVGQTPVASTTLAVGATPGWYRATFASPTAMPGRFFVAVDLSAQNVFVPESTLGARSSTFVRPSAGGAWVPSQIQRVPWRLLCPEALVPAIGRSGQPRLGTTYQVQVESAPVSTLAALTSGFSHRSWGGNPLPVPLPNAPGCELQVAAEITHFVMTDAAGAAAVPVGVPNSATFLGFELFHQWLVLDSVNVLGAIVSAAAKVVVGP
ncbi:MAG: kelch motif-containing protein [bacterium]|nr:kelch motif-containing protein [bacterium]